MKAETEAVVAEIEKSLDVARETLSFHSKAEFTLSNLKSNDIRSGQAEMSRARYASAYPEQIESIFMDNACANALSWP